MTTNASPRSSLWPHRLAVMLALVTFPLIWVGGLVTTYDAGMAVPDWPGTYGYNLFRYPWQSWIAGPFDLFIEHGHRLLGATAGMVAIGLLAVVVVSDRRPQMVLAAALALLLVIVQGALGGARVLFDARQIAMVHACVGPLFFAYLAVLSVATSPWFATARSLKTQAGNRFARGTITLCGLAYAQLMLGALLRHMPLGADAGLFRAALWLHLVVAGGVLVVSALIASGALRLTHESSGWSTLPGLVMLLVVLQIALGAGTYVVKYAFPGWLQEIPLAAGYVVHEKSLTQSLVTTAHVAMGSLLLFLSAMQATAAARVFFPPAKCETLLGRIVNRAWRDERRVFA